MNVTKQYVNYFYNLYEYYEEKLNSFLKKYLGETDPRTSQWALTRSPIPLLLIFSLYYIISFLGPRIMKNRKALEIRKILMTYNVAQIFMSTFIMKEIIVCSYHGGFSLTCQPIDISMNPIAVREDHKGTVRSEKEEKKMKRNREVVPIHPSVVSFCHKVTAMAGSSWWYHISKYMDLLDTVFLVLRKKGQQMTFLHMFHHSTMLFNSYLGILYLPGGQAIVSTFLNAFVHVIMYWYYLISAVGPKFHKYLWWKKYLTILQLTQFFTVLAHVFLGSLSGCEVPNWLKIYVIYYVSLLIVLFINFYFSSYKKMSLMKMLTCACLQNHLKKSPGELKEESLYLEKKIEKDLKDEIKLNDLTKRDGNKAKSPFTVVNRSIQDRTEERFGDFNSDKDKDI